MGRQTYCEASEEFPAQGKVVPALLSVLGDAAIDEEPCGSGRSIDALQLVRNRHRQTVVKRNSDHKDDPPPRLPVIVKDSNRRYLRACDDLQKMAVGIFEIETAPPS